MQIYNEYKLYITLKTIFKINIVRLYIQNNMCKIKC